MNIQVKVEDGYIEELMARTGEKNVCSLMSSVFGFYYWYLSELEIGRVVLSCSHDGSMIERVLI